MTNSQRITATELWEAEMNCRAAVGAAESLIPQGTAANVHLLLLVLRATSAACNTAANLLDGVASEREDVAGTAARAEGKAALADVDKHRHKFNDAGVCTVCGKPKSANGRKPAGAPEAPPVDTRALRLPIPPLGDAAADRFAGGGLGSGRSVGR